MLLSESKQPERFYSRVCSHVASLEPVHCSRRHEICIDICIYCMQVPLKQWAEAPKLTYPSSNAQQYLLWGAVVLTWAHTCGTGETGQASCNKVAAEKYQKIVDQMWRQEEVLSLPVAQQSSLPMQTCEQLQLWILVCAIAELCRASLHTMI